MEGTIGLVGLNDRVPSKGKIGSLRNFADRAMNNIKDRSTSRGGEKKRKTQKLTDMYGGPSMRGINNDVVSRRLHGIISSNLQNTLSNNTGTIQHIENNKSPSNFHPSALSPPPSNYWQTDFGAKRKTTDIIQNLGEAAIRVSPAKKMVRIDREAMARMYRETLIKTQLENQQKLAALKQKRELAQKNNPNQPKLALNKEEQKTENEHREIPTNTRYLRFIKGVENVYQSLVFTIFFAGIIFLSLFLRDFWVMAFNADKDATSDLIIELIFLFFTLESVINSVVFRNYRFSFVFLLDTISTWTIVIDLTSVPFISDDDFRSIKGQLAFKIFKLFNVLKLWRATRLFFRKNQTKRYIPINETTIKMNHTSAVAQFNQIKKMQQIKRQKTEFMGKSNKSNSQKDKGQFPFVIAAPALENSEQHHLLQKDGNGNLASLRLKNLNEDLNNSEIHGSEVNDSMYKSEGEGASNFDEQPKPRKGSHDVGDLSPDQAKDTLEQLGTDHKGDGFLLGGDKLNKSGFHAQYANEARAGDKLVKETLLEVSGAKQTDKSAEPPNTRKPSQDNIFAIDKLEAVPAHDEVKQNKVHSIAGKFLNEIMERKDSTKQVKPVQEPAMEMATLQVKLKDEEEELSMAEFIKSLRASEAMSAPADSGAQQMQHRTKGGLVALFKSTVKRFSDNLDHFNKERSNYIVRESARQFIFKNKLEAKGNIRKTISYRNVGTIACTVLMANLGLNIFVSSLFLNTPDVCGNDVVSLETLVTTGLQDSSISRPMLINRLDLFYRNTVSKYQKANTEVLQMAVSNYYNFTKGTVSQYRDEEVTYCTTTFTGTMEGTDAHFRGQIEILLDNQQQAFVGALLNILRSIFIVVSLLYNVVMTNVDIKTIIMDPIENIFIESAILSVKPLEIANLLPSHKEQQASEDNTLETEWKIISKVINLSTCWLVNIFGSCSENFIAKVINYEDFELKNTQGMDTFGIFCYFDSSLLNEYLTRLIVSEDFVEVYNKCLELVHNEIDMMRGEIYSLMPCEYIFCWQFNDDEILNEAIGVEGDALADLRASYSTAKAELAFTAITSALFKLRVYLRNYTYRAHDELDFVFENLVVFSMHSGWAIKGPVGGEQKVDLTLISQTIQTTIRLAKYATKFNVDFVMSDQVRNILSKKTMNALFEVEKHVKVVVEDAILDGPFTLYTIQLNERLINGFEITSLGTDKDGESGFNFIIFKKSREEKMIYHKFARRDCYFAILKPSLRKYIVDNSEVQNYYTKALNYYEKRNFKAAELNIKEIETIIRTAFKPGVVLLKKIEFKRRTHKPKENIQAKLRDLNMHDTDAGLRGGPKDGSATPSEARTRREPVDMNRLSAKNIRVSAN